MTAVRTVTAATAEARRPGRLPGPVHAVRAVIAQQGTRGSVASMTIGRAGVATDAWLVSEVLPSWQTAAELAPSGIRTRDLTVLSEVLILATSLCHSAICADSDGGVA